VILAFDKASLNRIRNGIVEGHSVYRQALGIHCNLHLEKWRDRRNKKIEACREEQCNVEGVLPNSMGPPLYKTHCCLQHLFRSSV